MEIAAAAGCPNLPAVQNSFATTATAVYTVFTYSGGNDGDNFAVEFIEPNGTVYKTDNFTQTVVGGTHCYSYFIDIAGYTPASTPGTWTAAVLWNGTTTLASVEFAIGAPQITNMVIAAAGGCPSLPAAQTSFATTATAVYTVFTYTGGNAGDTFEVEFIEPNGTVYKTDNFTQAGKGGTYCYSYFIDISGNPPASATGTWNATVLWDGFALASPQFTIGAAQGGAAPSPVTATVTEYPLPTTGSFPSRCSLYGQAGPWRIAAGPDGAMWFTEAGNNMIGRITTAGAITEYCIPTAAATPQGITAGPDGNVWFIESTANKVGRITPSGTITEFPIPASSSEQEEITLGPDGNLWFTDLAGNIGRVTPSGSITVFPLGQGGVPAASCITVGPDGKLWLCTGGIVTATPSTPPVVNNVAGTFNGLLDTPEWIAAGPDGGVWITGEDSNNILRLTTAGALTLNQYIPTNGSAPIGIVAGADGALWFTESSGSKIGRITTGGIITNEFIVPSGSSGIQGIAAGPDGALWFADQNANEIGRLVITTPVIQSGGVVNAATNQAGIVSGSWVSIYGDGFSGVTTNWNNASFANGLPTTLGNTQVTFNGQPGALFYDSATQLNAQATSNLSGTVSVQVTNNGVAGAVFSAPVVAHAPGLFAYSAGGTMYPAAIFYPDGTIVGDPSVVPGTRKANVGDLVELYATGLGPSPGGVLISSPVAFTDPVIVMIGSTQVTASYAGLVAPGEFQINFAVPTLPAGNYPLVIQTDGASSQAGVILPIGN